MRGSEIDTVAHVSRSAPRKAISMWCEEAKLEREKRSKRGVKKKKNLKSPQGQKATGEDCLEERGF